MKRSTKSLILFGVFAVLLGSYTAVNQLSQQQEVTEEEGSFSISEHSTEELVGLRWTNDEVDYHFEKADDVWVNADDGDFPTDQEALQSLADRLVNITASRKLTDVSKLEDYGLDADSFSVTAEWSDGESSVYYVGDETPFADGYYTCIEGEDGVIYTTGSSISAIFSDTLIDLAELEEIGTVEQASELFIGDTLALYYSEESRCIDPDQHWYSADGEHMDDAAIESLISEISALDWQELVSVHASEDELTEYQLDDLNATRIEVTSEDEDSIVLYIGTVDESGAYYARLSNSNMVYTLDAESVESIVSWDVDGLWNNEIFPLEYEDVQQFTCTLDGTELLFENNQTTEEEGEEDTEESDPSEEIWDQIHSLYATSRSDVQISDEPLLKISILSVADVVMDCEIYSYDVDSYLIQTSENRSLLLSADDVDKLIRALKQL